MQILHGLVVQLKRHSTLFFGSTDPSIPLGLALRTPSYLSTKLCLDKLLQHGHIELLEEHGGTRVLIKGRPSCFDLAN